MDTITGATPSSPPKYSRLPYLFTSLIALYLLIIQFFDAIWALPATIIYSVYLLLLLGLSVRNAITRKQTAASVTVSLWLLLTIVLIVAAYVPSGWVFGNRALLMLAVIGMGGFRASTAPPKAILNLLVFAVTLTLTIFLTYGIDRAVGSISGKRKPGGLVFPRNTSVTYRTTEFTHTVNINSYGFRGANVDLATPTDCRIMLLGDSFTYGWGVDYEQTWGALLEQTLRQDGINAQVLNLGMPGGNPPDYAAIAQAAVPILQPDVILVGILQGDDMRQMSREAALFPRDLSFGEVVVPNPLREYMSFHYPFIAERTLLARTSAVGINRNWAATAAKFISEHTPEQRTRYNNLPDDLKTLFINGDMNPHFLNLAVIAPDYWVWVLQDKTTLTPYITQMSGIFTDIVTTAPDAKTAIVSVPYGAYTQPEAREDLQHFGFILPPEILESSLVDDAIEEAANRVGMPFWKVTDAFRQHEALAFYPIDGHFNAEGNRLFAEAISPDVDRLCR